MNEAVATISFMTTDGVYGSGPSPGRQQLFSRHHLPEALQSTLPSKMKRAWGRPGARGTRGLAGWLHKRYARHEHRGSAVGQPAAPTQWLYGLYEIVLVTLLFVTPSSARGFHLSPT